MGEERLVRLVRRFRIQARASARAGHHARAFEQARYAERLEQRLLALDLRWWGDDR